jgi:hypothetical protein
MSPDEGEVIGVHLLARTEKTDVKIRDGRICLPNLLHVHRVTICISDAAEQARAVRVRVAAWRD